MAASLLLLRHGETDWNRAGRQQGRGDSPLTPRGRRQAETLARAARALGVGRVLSSPLGRAAATAVRVAATADCRLERRIGLIEMDFGACTGLTLAEVRRRFPGFLEAREQDRWRQRWPDGESYADVLERLRSGLADDLPLATDPPTAVVAHQSVNRALLAWLAAGTCPDALEGEQPANVLLRVAAAGTVDHWVVTDPAARPAWRPGVLHRPRSSDPDRPARAA